MPGRNPERASGEVSVSALSDFARGVAGPVTVVFATFRFRELLARWVESAQAAGCLDYRIVCMDDALLGYLREQRAETRAVSYYSLFPSSPRVDIDAIAQNWRRLHVLTPLRVGLFRALTDNGIDFIHSDADAFWLRDPRPWLERHGEYDLLCSQDCASPPFHYERHGFVLCAGFFLCRANERTARLWAAVEARRDIRLSDQWRLNAVLLNDASRNWSITEPRPAFRSRGGWRRSRRPSWFRLPLGPRAGERVWCWLGNERHRRRFHGLLKACGLMCILTSEHVIHGRFSDGLSVGVIPMSLVARQLIEGDGPPEPARLHVLHVLENKSMIAERWQRTPTAPAWVRWWYAAVRRRARRGE